jgi:hypothetical protein
MAGGLAREQPGGGPGPPTEHLQQTRGRLRTRFAAAPGRRRPPAGWRRSRRGPGRPRPDATRAGPPPRVQAAHRRARGAPRAAGTARPPRTPPRVPAGGETSCRPRRWSAALPPPPLRTRPGPAQDTRRPPDRVDVVGGAGGRDQQRLPGRRVQRGDSTAEGAFGGAPAGSGSGSGSTPPSCPRVSSGMSSSNASGLPPVWAASSPATCAATGQPARPASSSAACRRSSPPTGSSSRPCAGKPPSRHPAAPALLRPRRTAPQRVGRRSPRRWPARPPALRQHLEPVQNRAEQVGQPSVGQLHLGLGATRAEHQAAGRLRSCPAQQRALAHPSLAADDQGAAAALAGVVEQLGKASHLPRPSNQHQRSLNGRSPLVVPND